MANIGGNFVNPAYASPQQIAALREYAKQLLTEQPVHHWAQGLGNVARALMGGYEARQADVQEQASNKEFGKQLLEATSSKDPAKILSLMSNPRAQPLQALLIGKLLEWGPEQGVTLPSGVALRKPVEPYFSQEPRPTSPVQGSTTPIAPTPVQTTNELAPGPGSVGDVVPGSRTVTGDSDETFNMLGRQFGVPNLAELNRVGTQQAAELAGTKAAAELKATQQQVAAAQAPASTPVRQRIPEEIKAIQKQLEAETFYNPLTGKAGYVRAQVPATPANNLFTRLESLKALAGQLHEDELRAISPTGRVLPQQIEDYKQGLNLDLRDPAALKRGLDSLMKKYGGGTGFSPTPQPVPPQGAFPAQAGESTGGGYKVLKVTPYGGY